MFRRVMLSLVVLLGSTGLPGDLRAVDDSAEEKLSIELKFRRDFGLNADPTFVRALMADAAAYDESFPVALTDGERSEMKRRIAMEDALAPLETFARALPESAGIWIDQPAGGVVKVALTAGADKQRATLEGLAPAGARLEIVSARFTLSELESAERRLRQEADGFVFQGHQLNSWYVDIDSNRLAVGVSRDHDAALAALQAAFGDVVSIVNADPVFTDSGCYTRDHCRGPALRGGITAPTNATVPCSLGFLVYRGTSEVGWLTAGHCARTIGANWWHHDISIGTIRATCYPSCQYSDAARGAVVPSGYYSNWVYAAGDSNGKQVWYPQALNGDGKGYYVCLNARRAEAWRCGYIEVQKATVCYERDAQGNCTVWFDEQRLASFPNKVGDSGGAVHSAEQSYSRVIAYGIESGCTYLPPGSDTCQGWGIYSHIARVQAELGVTVCAETYGPPCG